MKVLETIEAGYSVLTNSEKTVADYFLEEKYDIVTQTLSEISEKTKVGDATIVRFCHKLGFKSFMELKYLLDLEKNDETVTQSNGYITTIEKRINNTIRKTIELLDLAELDKAIKMIDEAEHLVVIGASSSGVSAQAFSTRLLRAGKLCQCFIDPHLHSVYASWAQENSLMVVFSLSGTAMDIIESVKLAKLNGVKIIAITNFKNSPIAKLADVVILTLSRARPLDGGGLVALINQVFVADLLITGYSLLDEEKSLSLKKATYKAISDKLSG